MLHVLVVDDEAALRRLFCRVIEREGVTSAEAESAEDALHIASDNPPQAIRVRDGVSTRTAPLS